MLYHSHSEHIFQLRDGSKRETSESIHQTLSSPLFSFFLFRRRKRERERGKRMRETIEDKGWIVFFSPRLRFCVEGENERVSFAHPLVPWNFVPSSRFLSVDDRKRDLKREMREETDLILKLPQSYAEGFFLSLSLLLLLHSGFMWNLSLFLRDMRGRRRRMRNVLERKQRVIWKGRKKAKVGGWMNERWTWKSTGEERERDVKMTLFQDVSCFCIERSEVRKRNWIIRSLSASNFVILLGQKQDEKSDFKGSTSCVCMDVCVQGCVFLLFLVWKKRRKWKEWTRETYFYEDFNLNERLWMYLLIELN